MITACDKLTKKQLPAPWAQAFPGYKGRKFSLQIHRQVGLRGFWDGGCKSEYVAIDLRDGSRHEASAALQNPMNAVAHQELPLRPEFVIAEHARFLGSDMGITFHVHPEAVLHLQALGSPLAALVAGAGV